jgi:transposase
VFLRTVKSNGVEYVQLCHNYREGGSGPSRTKVIHGYGRKDNLDYEALKRLIVSVSRYLEPDDARELLEEAGVDAPFEFLGAKQLGGTHLLDGVWRRLELDKAFKRLLGEREFKSPVERLLFAMVANRALDPGSKLGVESWVADEAYVQDLPGVEVQQLYRAMDFLLLAHDEIQREVFWQVSNLFNLEVDLLFVDTTTTYFEIEGEDQDDEVEGLEGLRKRGYSKDSRPDLAQAVIAFAVTRDGIPVRCWVFPGNRADVSLVEEVKRDLNTWKLGRVVLVMDTGFNSEENRRALQGAGDAYIIGEKLRLGPNGKLPEALTRPGRYKRLENGLRVKEVTTNRDSVMARRFVIVHNQSEAERDKATRDAIRQEAERRLAEIDQQAGEQHTKAVCDLRAHKTYGRYLRQTKAGKLVLNKSKITAEEKLDGKFLVSTSDTDLSAEDVALGYKQLFEIERVNRDLKHTVDVRPVYHRRGNRIKAHVLLCWLSLLLIRIIENETGETWANLKKLFRPLLAGYHQTRHGPIVQTNKLTKEQTLVLDALKLKPPGRYLELPTPRN